MASSSISRRQFAAFSVASSAIWMCHNSISAPLNGGVWPTKALRLLVGFPAGSTPDTTARVLADGLARVLGQPVVVENRPGAAGNIAADLVAKSTDGHTFGVLINGNLTSAKLLNPRLPYDPDRDFSFISLLTAAPLLLVTQASEPAGAAFFVAAKAAGARWNYGSVGNGSVAHLGMELLKSKVPGLDAVHVPFGGNPQVATALIAGQIQMALLPPGIALPQIRAGKLRAIGLTGSRSTLVPEVPSLAELGIPDYALEVINALVGPASLPAGAVARLSNATVEVLRAPENRQRLFHHGWQAIGTAPEGLENRIRKEAAQLGAIIRKQGIRLDS